MGGWPGIVPGQIALGQSSALAGAPSMTGGILSIDSSSLGNLKPASLNALPKSFNFGKSIWQVLQLVPYILANAGMARQGCAGKSKNITVAINNKAGFRALFGRNTMSCVSWVVKCPRLLARLRPKARGIHRFPEIGALKCEPRLPGSWLAS